jgi:hypothetical protein
MHDNDRLPDAVAACCMQLWEALRSAASVLKEHGPRFALAGSYALWAYGAPEPSHDVDVVVRRVRCGGAAATLSDAGFSVEHSPEDWLFKTGAGEVVVDVLHRLNGVAVEQATLLVQKLRSLGEHHNDFAVAFLVVASVLIQKLARFDLGR